MSNHIASKVAFNNKMISLRGKGITNYNIEKEKTPIEENLITEKLMKVKKGGGIEGIDQIRDKMEKLTIKPTNKKIKNIKFSI